MKVPLLTATIDDKVQTLMLDAFEYLEEQLQKGGFTPNTLLLIKPYFACINELLAGEALLQGDYRDLETALIIEVKEQAPTPEDQLMYIWQIMVDNVERATNHAHRNASFAFFVPIILQFMEAYDLFRKAKGLH